MIKLFAFSSDLSSVRDNMLVSKQWTDKDFMTAQNALRSEQYSMDSQKGDLNELRNYLNSKRDFMLNLLANPNRMEHDTFTDLLWAVFHIVEELCARHHFSALPQSDFDHISGDLKRAFTQLLIEWLSYMKHLKEDYPYIFSLAVRMNPMDINATPVVK